MTLSNVHILGGLSIVFEKNLQAGVSGTQAQRNELDKNSHGQNRKKRSYIKKFYNEPKESLMYSTLYSTGPFL